MEFVWNDGGRAACGFVGAAGDCVTRAIAIATGRVYRDVYDSLGNSANKSPRDGIAVEYPAEYLADLGWKTNTTTRIPFSTENVPKGVVVCFLSKKNGRSAHFCTVIDHVIHDTWNPFEDECYFINAYWVTKEEPSFESKELRANPRVPRDSQQEMTQKEFDKVLRRLRALDSTASNDASTEGEKRNAIRMMQSMMLTHNLTREDLQENEPSRSACYTRMACPLNGKRACTWEASLAWYVTSEVFPAVQFYQARKSNRSLFWFYGGIDDVENCIALFRELLVTIAASAKLQYGGYSRGSGASYAEGYVEGLPRVSELEVGDSKSTGSSDEDIEGDGGKRCARVRQSQQLRLLENRNLTLKKSARRWLARECDIHLSSGGRSGRHSHDASAQNAGRKDGAKQSIAKHGRRKGIAFRN